MGVERLERRRLLSFLDIQQGGALTYSESFGGTQNQLTVTSSGPSGNYTIHDEFQTITLSSNAQILGWTGSGTNDVTGPVSSVSSLTFTPQDPRSDLFIGSTDDPITVVGYEFVDVGGPSTSLQQIRQPITIMGMVQSGGAITQTSVALDDSTDPTGRNYVVSTTGVTGASPAPIQFAIAQVSFLTIDAGTGDDNVALDFSSGNPVPTQGGIVYDGGGGTNSLTLSGGQFANEVINGSQAGSASVLLDASSIDLTNVTSVVDTTTAANLSVDLPDSQNTIAVVDGPIVGNVPTLRIQGADVPPHFPRFDVANKISVSISTSNESAGPGPQTVTVNAPTTPAGLQFLGVTTGMLDDQITLTATPPGVGTSVNGGDGDDTIDIAAAGLGAGGSTSIDGDLGNNTLNIDAGGAGVDFTETDVTVAGHPPISIANIAQVNITNAADPPLTPTPRNLPATEGVPLANVVVGMFFDDDPQGQTSQFSARIDWGDGTPTTDGVVSFVGASTNPPGSVFNVLGSHTYAQSGQYNVVVRVLDAGNTATTVLGSVTFRVTDPGGSATQIGSAANVADAPLTFSPTPVNAIAGAPFSGPVGRFTDANPLSAPGDFTATIDWGDGTTATTGTISQPGGPGTAYVVSGTHTYATPTPPGSPGTTITVTIVDRGGARVVGTTTARIAGAFQASGIPVTGVVEGVGFTRPVARFTTGNPQTPASSFSATIDWGDGTTPSPGAIAKQADGSFLVNGTHTYAEDSFPRGPYTITVTIATPQGARTTVKTTATVLESFTVTSDADAGPGSLRALIAELDADRLGGTIRFNIPGPGPHRIALRSELPEITQSIFIDGTTQPGFRGRPLIELSGALAGQDVDGLTFQGGSSGVHTLASEGGSSGVRGLIINGFDGSGVVLEGRGGSVVVGNFIGTDASGTRAVPNQVGIAVVDVGNNLIGGPSPALRNVISGNTDIGISLSCNGASGNRVLGNFIGTDVTGSRAVPNYQGVFILGAGHNLIGGPGPGQGNVISGNASAGVQIFNDATVFNGRPMCNPPGVATGNVVMGNLIGTDAAGTRALPNAQGVFINDASGNVIGGPTKATGNVIAGNRTVGLQILGDHATRNVVVGNLIGTDREQSRRLGNAIGVYVYAQPGNFVDLSAGPSGNVLGFNTTAGLRGRSLSQGPQVESARPLPGPGGRVAGVVLLFTMYLDRARALNPSNYVVNLLGPGGSVGRRIPVTGVAYNEIYRTTVLTFASPLPAGTLFQLRVVGTSPGGLTDRLGNFLDGAGGARSSAGSDYVTAFRGLRPIGGTASSSVAASSVSATAVDALSVRGKLGGRRR